MHPSLRLLAPAILLLSLACQPRGSAPVYGPWEEGLTLAFEDPTKPQPERSSERRQVRVAHGPMKPGSPDLVQVELTTLQGQWTLQLRFRNGGIEILSENGRGLVRLLPVGFPATAAWTDGGTEFRVIGRAAWDGAAILPPTSDPVGVWVESRSARGPRHRTLFLPNLGEVEIQEERSGAWVTVNRLVARGFTDTPTPAHR